ncbi:hypothetical protein EOW77_0031575 [Bradyrhizobium yuanmingense]|uniref:hypothetical protein n=1 Tax=Bradyrhizobium yuanmingense TaxID=108015 RepID=UPI000FE3C78C|nr:hypothetical protein [Bradyrhizobium yuanmingense]TGN76204.1 hypothetical protein EOW77_0031575 [Bradyrhizobium yuanmingense]
MPDFSAPWWSIDDAIIWVASADRASLPKDYFWEPPEFDDYAYFGGLRELELALLEGEIIAHASIDAAPVGPVHESFWSSMNFVPFWSRSQWPVVLIHSQDAFRADALLDHSEPSNTKVPDAKYPEGAFGFYRVARDVTFRRDEILERWTIQTIREPLSKTAPKTRAKRKLTLKVEASLAKMTHNGLSLARDKRGLSDADIAELLLERWHDEGDTEVREFEAVKKQVWRYYDRLRTLANA